MVEFKQSALSDICKSVCAFANTRTGGKILLGVDDGGNPLGITKDIDYKQKISDEVNAVTPVPRLDFDEITFDDKKIVLISVKPSNFLVSFKNIVYLRVGVNNYPLSIEEVIERSAESLRVYFDKLKSPLKVDCLDTPLLEDYVKTRSKVRGAHSHKDLLRNARAANIVEGKMLTNAGLLCFTKDPQSFVSGATVRVVEFTDQDMTQYKDRKEFTGPLPSLVDSLEQYFLKNLKRVGGFQVGFTSQDYLEYPLDALREVLINAIVHRNYFDPSETLVFLYPNRLEISNPGSFPPGVTLEEPEHKPRNPVVAQIFYDLGLTEKYGSGIRKIQRSVKQHPFVDVEFKVKPYRTRVIFRKKVDDTLLDSVNRKIVEFLLLGEKSSGEIADYVGFSRQAVVSRLNDLITLGLVYRTGQGPTTRYGYARRDKKVLDGIGDE